MRKRDLAKLLLDTAVPSRWSGLRGLELDGWQRKIADAGPGTDLVLCSRQSGKTTVAAVLIAHLLSVLDNALVLILSVSERQAQEVLRRAALLIDPGVLAASGASHLYTRYGGRAYALPGSSVDTIRGFSAPDLVVLDEAAMIRDDLYYAVRPMLATTNGRSRLVMLTTPKGKRGFFWEEWTSAESVRRTKVVATEVPRIPAEWLSEERKRLPEWVYLQEYMCEFVDTDQQLFATDLVDSMFVDADAVAFDDVLPVVGEALRL